MKRNSFGQVYQKRGQWFARYPNGRKTLSGRPSYTVRRLSSKAKAAKFLKEVRAAQLAGRYQPAGPSVYQGASTVAQATQGYIDAKAAEGRSAGTLEQYGITLKAVRLSGLGAMSIHSVTPQAVRAHLAWRRQHPLAGSTVSNAVLYRDRSLIFSVFRWLIDEGHATTNPVRKVAVPKKAKTTRRPFDREEVQQFLEECHPVYLRPMVVTGLHTGLAANELISLRWRDVSFSRKTIAVVRKKTGEPLYIALHADVAAELKQLRKVQRFPDMEAYVFLSRYGTPYREFPREAWRGALGRAGLEGRGLQGPHSLRRTFATEFRGEDRDLKELLGHADLSTTLLYRRFKPSRAREAVLALDFKPAKRRKAQ